MKLIQEIKKINDQFNEIDQTASVEKLAKFEALLAEKNINPVKTLYIISLFATAVITVLKLVKLFTGDKVDKAIDDIIETLSLIK